MTRYIINETLYSTNFMSSAGASGGMIFTYDFKIDTNGNIYVKYGRAQYNERQPEPTIELFSIIDNIPIPEYTIELFVSVMKTHCIGQPNYGNGACRLEKMEMFFDIVKHLKKSASEIQNIEDKKEKRTMKMQNKIAELDTKIAKIQVLYNEALNDNNTLKEFVYYKDKDFDIERKLHETKTIQQQDKIMELETKIENIQVLYNTALNENNALKKTMNDKDKDFEVERKLHETKTIQQQDKIVELEKKWNKLKIVMIFAVVPLSCLLYWMSLYCMR